MSVTMYNTIIYNILHVATLVAQSKRLPQFFRKTLTTLLHQRVLSILSAAYNKKGYLVLVTFLINNYLFMHVSLFYINANLQSDFHC